MATYSSPAPKSKWNLLTRLGHKDLMTELVLTNTQSRIDNIQRLAPPERRSTSFKIPFLQGISHTLQVESVAKT